MTFIKNWKFLLYFKWYVFNNQFNSQSLLINTFKKTTSQLFVNFKACMNDPFGFITK